MTYVFIICLPRTGSTVLAKTFRDDGMWVGNEKTAWNDNFDRHCEHSILTACGSRLLNGPSKWEGETDLDWRRWLQTIKEHPSDAYVIAHIRNILRGYKKEAKGDFVGVKVTITHPKLIDVFCDIVSEEWPDVIYYSTVRHPMSYAKEDIDSPLVQDWQRACAGYKGLLDRKGVLVSFPSFWSSVFECDWSDWDDPDIFDPEKVHEASDESKLRFANRYPEIEKEYQYLISRGVR